MIMPADDTPPKPKGVACPKCGGIRLRVFRTLRYARGVVRVKLCKTCGHRFRTVERVESHAD